MLKQHWALNSVPARNKNETLKPTKPTSELGVGKIDYSPLSAFVCIDPFTFLVPLYPFNPLWTSATTFRWPFISVNTLNGRVPNCKSDWRWLYCSYNTTDKGSKNNKSIREWCLGTLYSHVKAQLLQRRPMLTAIKFASVYDEQATAVADKPRDAFVQCKCKGMADILKHAPGTMLSLVVLR